MAKKRRNKERRSGKPGCLSLLFLIVVLVIAVVSMIFIFFKTKTVTVVNNLHYSAEVVAGASEIDIGDNLVFISKHAISRKITTQLPYVATVRITRELPDTIVITVTECSAAGFFEVGGSFWLVDATGKLLERVNEKPSNLAHISGVTPILPVEGSRAAFGGDEEVKLKTVADTLAALEARGMTADVSEIGIGGVYDVTIVYLDRFTVMLGAPEEMDYKLDYLLEIVQNNIQPNERGVLDLSRLIEDSEARFRRE